MIQTATILAILAGILVVYWQATGKSLNVGSYLLSIYFLSILTSFVIAPFEDHIYSFEASFYFVAILLLFLIPILRFDSNKVRSIAPVNRHLFDVIAYIFIALGIITYVVYLPTVVRIFLSSESLAAARSYVVGGETNYEVNGVFYVLAVFWQFFPVILAFYFYSITHTSHGKVFNGLLLFSSSSYILSVLLAVGRDGFVLWTMSYLLAYLLFRRFMSRAQKRSQRRLAYGLGCLFVCFFGLITASRHLQGDNYSKMMVTTASYFGMGFGNFNNFYNAIDQRQDDLSTVLPILRYAGMHRGDQTLQERNDKYNARYGIDINVFATFVGDLFLCMSRRTLMFVSMVYGGILWVMLRSRRTVTFGGLIFVVVITQLPLHGVFYDKLMYVVSDIYLIMAIMLSGLLALKGRPAGSWQTGEGTGSAGMAEPSA